MANITWSDKSDGDGTTATTRVSAADMNEVKAAVNSKEDAWVPTPVSVGSTTLALTHEHADFRFAHATPILSIPTQASVAFPANFKVSGRAVSGVNIVAVSGVTLNGVSGGSQAIGSQNSGAFFELVRDAANSWVLFSGQIPAIASVTGLQAALDGKAATDHTHTIAQVDGLSAALESVGATPSFGTVAAMLADTTAYGASRVAGGKLIAAGISYTIADSGASDHHLQTAATTPVKLYADPDQDGYRAVEAWGVLGDGSAGDLARINSAINATPYLRWLSKTYHLGERIASPANVDTGAPRPGGSLNVYSGYTSYQWRCLHVTGTDIRWRTHGETVLRITDAQQSTGVANDILILLHEDANHFSAPGFVFDENAAGQGYGGPIGIYGVLDVDLDRITVRNGGPLRMGATVTRLCGKVRGFVTVEGGVGSFGVGSKPGGVDEYVDFGVRVINGRGGLNIEAEDVDKRRLDHRVKNANIATVIGRNIHDTSTAGVEFVKIENGAKQVVVDRIDLESASATVGRATALCIKAGQGTPDPIESVSVGSINVKDTLQAVYVESEDTPPHGDIRVGSIHAERSGSLLSCLNGQGMTPGVVRSIIIGNVQGVVSTPANIATAAPANPATGIAFSVNSDGADTANNARPPHLALLQIGGGHLTSVGMRTFSTRGVMRFEARNLTVDAHVSTSPTGGYAGTAYNVIEADEIVLDDVTLRGFAGSATPLVLRSKVSCRLVGLDLTGNGAGSALFLGGSGKVIIDSCTFRGATNAINITASQNTFNAATAVNAATDRITITGHVFRHGDKVRYTAGSTPIGGLTGGQDYYVLYIDANTIQLSATLRGAAIDLTSVGAGTATLKRALDLIVTNCHNECPTFIANGANALSVFEGFAAHNHAIGDVTGLQAALDLKAESVHTHTASSVTDFDTATDAAIDTAFGAGDGVLAETGGVKSKLDTLTFGPATIFDVQTGQADTSSAADLALWDWFSSIRTGTIVANVATLDWSTDSVSRPSITAFDAAASFTLVLPTLPSEMTAMGARQYRVQALVRNVGVPTITVTLAGAGAGQVPLRGSNPTNDFGDWLLITADYRTPLGFATVTTQDLGASVPPYSAKIASNRATGSASITFSSAGFNPHIYPADEVLVFMTREVGTGITLPSGKPWVFASGGGLDVNGMIANGTDNASRLAIASGHAEQDVGGSGAFTNSRSASIIAYRGLDIDSYAALAGTDNSVEYGSFAAVPDGGFAVYYTAVNQAAAVIPAGSIAIHDAGDAVMSPGGWRYTTRRVDPAAGVIAPSPVALAASAYWHTIGVLMVPE